MEFKLKTLEIEGFKSFIKRTVIDFDQLGPGLIYLAGDNEDEPSLGSNGAGKSSIWDAVCWCLQGCTTDGLRGPDIRPFSEYNYKGPTVVIVKVVVGDKTHTIFRQQSPNAFELDGKECTQEKLHRLLGQSLEFMTHTMILGQGQPLFFNRTPKEMMSLFSEVLDLEKWERRSDHARDVLAIRQGKLMDLQIELEGYDQQLLMLKNLIGTAQSKHNEWQEQRDAKIDDVERAIKTAEREQAANQKRLDEANLATDSAGTEAKAMLKEVDARQADLASARHFYNKEEATHEILRGQYRELKQQLKEMTDGAKCPTCGQVTKGPASVKHRRHIQKTLDEAKAVLDKGISEEATAKVSLAQKQLETTIAHRNKFLDQEDSARSLVNRYAPIAAEYKTRIAVLKRDIRQLEEDGNPHRAELSDLRKRRERLAADKDELLEAKKRSVSLIARTKFWVKGFKDIRLMVIDDVLKQLEFATNAILQEVGLHKWKIQYQVERETKAGKIRHGLNVLILSPKNKKAVKWQCWSGGEGRRLLIVGSLALSKVLLDYVGIETNLEVLDEPTQFIGEEGIEDIIEFLADRAKRLKRTIVYVDHGARESAFFDSTMLVTKDELGSHIQVQ